MNNIKVASVNILNKWDVKERYDLFIEHLRNQPMDVIGFQEVVETEYLKELLQEAGYTYVEYNHGFLQGQGITDYIMIASKTPLLIDENQEKFNEKEKRSFSASTVIDGQMFHFFVSHLEWGFQHELERLKEVCHIDSLAQSLELSYPGSVSVLLADCNASENSRTVRFLKGLDVGADHETSTYWVDAYALAGDKQHWITNDPVNNIFAAKTAIMANIPRPELVPARRIDYIMVRSWIYGKIGCPIKFGYLFSSDKELFTDHNAIFAELLMP